jgi:hypothetical protein
MAAALRDAIADLAPVLQSLQRIDQKSSRWEWLPDFALAIIDATRGVVFYATHHRELPKQLASWWRSNDAESRAVLTGFGVLGALFLLYCLRPVVGALLQMALPQAAIPRGALYWTFFWGTDAVCGKMVKPGSARKIEKSGAVFDVLYYSFGVFLVVGCLLASFIAFVGHPGGFGGAGAWARW